jgi:branched-chain amino acid transport system substrate-binding protein
MTSSNPWRAASVVLVSVCMLGLVACSDDGRNAEPSQDASGPAEVLGPVDRATGTPVRVGFVNVDGGPTLSLPEITATARAAVAYANDYLGGLGGHPIELEVCNDLADGASVVACGNQLVNDDVVAVVSGRLSSDEQITRTVAGAGIPFVGDFQGSAVLGIEHAYSVNSQFLALYGGLASAAEANGLERTAMISLDIPTLHDQVDNFATPAMDAAGLDLEFTAIPPGSADPTPEIAAAIAQSPDQIFVAGNPPFCRAALPAIAAANVADAPIFSSNTCVIEDVIESVGGALEGATTYAMADPNQEGHEADLYRTVLDEYAPGTDPYGTNGVGYLSVLALVRAYNAADVAGDPTAETVDTALAGAREVPLPLFDGATFTCDGRVIPRWPAVCAAYALQGVVEGDALTDLELVDGAGSYR